MSFESLIFLANASGEESHTSFYIFAGILAGWAVLVSAAGIARHRTFPRTHAVMVGIILITCVLVAGTLATAVATG